jgi:hypothetical protein
MATTFNFLCNIFLTIVINDGQFCIFMPMKTIYIFISKQNDGQCYPVTLQSVLPASRQWGSLLSQPKYYPIKVDFKV